MADSCYFKVLCKGNDEKAEQTAKKEIFDNHLYDFVDDPNDPESSRGYCRWSVYSSMLNFEPTLQTISKKHKCIIEVFGECQKNLEHFIVRDGKVEVGEELCDDESINLAIENLKNINSEGNQEIIEALKEGDIDILGEYGLALSELTGHCFHSLDGKHIAFGEYSI